MRTSHRAKELGIKTELDLVSFVLGVVAGAKSSRDNGPIDFVDPHFHVWSLDDGVADASILFKPDGLDPYKIEHYEAHMEHAGVEDYNRVSVYLV